MKFFLHLFIFILAGVLILPGCFASEQSSVSNGTNLTWYTEHLPPYNFIENGTLKGFTIDLLDEISAITKTQLSHADIHLAPWDEGYNAALNGNRSVIFATARIPEREDSFHWVGPLSKERYVLFADRNSSISVNGTEDLKGQKIGVITDDASSKLLLNAGVSEDQIVAEKNLTDLIEKSQKKEIDLFCYPEISGLYYIGKETGNFDAFKIVYPINEVEIYYAFSKDVPAAEVKSYQDALDKLKEGKSDKGVSKYLDIMRNYIPNFTPVENSS